MKKHFKLSDYAVTYSTRTKGDEIAYALKDFIESFNNDDYLVIDFDGVKAISYSFLDQFLSNVISFDFLKEKEISIAGWSQDVLSVIDRSLQHRHCDYSPLRNERILVCQSNYPERSN
jgi:NDP-sugar pyrophosphorylase family protein